MEERERLSASPHREVTIQPGDGEQQPRRGSKCSELWKKRCRMLCMAVCAEPWILALVLLAVIANESDWDSSREHCQRLGASLATVDTEEQMEFMLRYLGPANCWIGLHRAEGDERWTWADGSTFSNWFQLRGGGRCAYLNGDRISSALCHTKKLWVCSRADSFVLWRNGTNPQ
ncbi:C-type lectin domain family 2 member B-like [Lagopus leucura]|uniref:C-type lectin domain family 2 member B-like n=1 Tax=Lagopus leucura TaxID=30410 RepID=UPI001C67A20B|nr:C-type lectin domain family 2 member B-like [Lagopus leucura]